MIGIDTNVLVRYIMQDDAAQAATATRFIERLTSANPGYISIVTMAEIGWVLARTYGVPRNEIIETIHGLLTTDIFVVERYACASLAVASARRGAEFADALIVQLDRLAGCVETVTFDRDAAKRSGMRLLT